MTSRGLVESDFEKVGDFIDRGIKIAIKVNKEGENSKKLITFKQALENNNYPDIDQLKSEVREFAKKFPMPE